MKLESKNIGLIMIAVLGISAGSIYAVMGGITLQSFGTPSQTSGALMTGHVDVVVRDQGGNIIAYRQADNAIVAHGMAIIIDSVFNNATGTDAGAAGSTHANTTNVLSEGLYTKVGWMSIGNFSTAPQWNNTNLACALETAGACVPAGTSRPTCVRVLSDIDNQTATGPGGDNNEKAQINVTAIATFAGTDCFSNTIQEAGIWNHPTVNTGHMFARNTFGSVTLTTTDSLELTWKFTFSDQ
jgi:hypothetical protein